MPCKQGYSLSWPSKETTYSGPTDVHGFSAFFLFFLTLLASTPSRSKCLHDSNQMLWYLDPMLCFYFALYRLVASCKSPTFSGRNSVMLPRTGSAEEEGLGGFIPPFSPPPLPPHLFENYKELLRKSVFSPPPPHFETLVITPPHTHTHTHTLSKLLRSPCRALQNAECGTI